jgi:hypothetical protein
MNHRVESAGPEKNNPEHSGISFNHWDEDFWLENDLSEGEWISYKDDPNFLESDHRGLGPKGYSRSDQQIKDDVCDILYINREVDARSIIVEVRQSCVYLKGSVKDRNQKKVAESLVESIMGVQDIFNELRILP